MYHTSQSDRKAVFSSKQVALCCSPTGAVQLARSACHALIPFVLRVKKIRTGPSNVWNWIRRTLTHHVSHFPGRFWNSWEVKRLPRMKTEAWKIAHRTTWGKLHPHEKHNRELKNYDISAYFFTSSCCSLKQTIPSTWGWHDLCCTPQSESVAPE
jgi:hypothetical protein